MYGYMLCVAGLISIAGCERSAGTVPVRVIDLIEEFERAEQRPPRGHRIPAHTAGNVTRPAIVMPVPSRVTWRLPLPRNGSLRTFVAVDDAAPGVSRGAVRFRMGIADDRIYEGLTALTVTPEQRGWIGFEADLSAYAGRKWSLFYRPDRIIWNVVLAADPGGAGGAMAVWGAPEIVTDARAAREYAARRRELRSSRLR